MESSALGTLSISWKQMFVHTGEPWGTNRKNEKSKNSFRTVAWPGWQHYSHGGRGGLTAVLEEWMDAGFFDRLKTGLNKAQYNLFCLDTLWSYNHRIIRVEKDHLKDHLIHNMDYWPPEAPFQPKRSFVCWLLLLFFKRKHSIACIHLLKKNVASGMLTGNKIQTWDVTSFHRLLKIQYIHPHKILNFA